MLLPSIKKFFEENRAMLLAIIFSIALIVLSYNQTLTNVVELRAQNSECEPGEEEEPLCNPNNYYPESGSCGEEGTNECGGTKPYGDKCDEGCPLAGDPVECPKDPVDVPCFGQETETKTESCPGVAYWEEGSIVSERYRQEQGTEPNCTWSAWSEWEEVENTCSCPAGKEGQYPDCTCVLPPQYDPENYYVVENEHGSCELFPRECVGDDCEICEGDECEPPPPPPPQCPNGPDGTANCPCPAGSTWNGTQCVTPPPPPSCTEYEDEETGEVFIDCPPARINITNNTSGAWSISCNNGIGYSHYGSSWVDVEFYNSNPISCTINGAPVSGYAHPPTYTSTKNTGKSMIIGPGQTAGFTLTYSLVSTFDYTLSASPAGSLTITKSFSGNTFGQKTINKNLISGPTQSVNLNVTGNPSGVSVAYALRDCSPDCASTINFTVAPSTAVGTYPITVTGTPGSKQVSFSLVVRNPDDPGDPRDPDDPTCADCDGGGGTFPVSCVASPSPQLVGRQVRWLATPNGGRPPYTYSWSGTNIPTNPAPTANPYYITYSTTGLKTAVATLRDASGNTGSCIAADSRVSITFNPFLEEF